MVCGKPSLQGYETNRRHADGVRVENIHKNHNVGPPSKRFKKLMKGIQCGPDHFNGRIIFMSTFNDIEWEEKGNAKRCEYNSQTVAECAGKFPRGHWSFLGPGSEEKWCGTLH